MTFQAIDFRTDGATAFIRFNRPQARNTINRQMVEECLQALDHCERASNVLVIEGGDDIFCFGADFQTMHDEDAQGARDAHEPERLYAIWERMARGPFVTVSHVKGKVNAGGMGFVAASDIVLSHDDALFSLSELIFDVMPACVLPFLIRRIGFQHAHYLTLTTQPIDARQACAWGLVDHCAADSEGLLRKHLLRLRRLSREGIARYKTYMNELVPLPFEMADRAIAANRDMFENEQILRNIHRFVGTGAFPWERD